MRDKFKKIRIITMPSLTAYILASFSVFIALFAITLWAWSNARQNLANDLRTNLNNSTSAINDTISNTLNSYSEVLRGSAALFEATNEVSAEAWRQYIASLDVVSRYPGLQAVSYIQKVPSGDLLLFLNEQQAADGRPIQLHPDFTRDTYMVTRFIEPMTEKARPALGFDPFTDPVRRKAMEQARDSGQPVITERTTLKRDDEQPQPGFVVYLPIFTQGSKPQTITERRQALQGFVSAGVRSNELINELLGDRLSPNIGLEIYDGRNVSEESLLYSSASVATLKDSRQPLTSVEQVIDKDSNSWTIVTYGNRQLTSLAQRKQPQEILVGGTLFSALLASLLFIIMTNRARSISEEKNREVQEAKDSLISLASHQLRTPATGVKQFIGMLLEGYAGKITGEQREMLEKAYQSNERQIDIINQILHVTRADSGRLVLHKKKVEINQVIQNIIDEYGKAIDKRGQTVIFSKDKPLTHVCVDPQYFAMAVDNLISNASKYSHKNTTIHISTEQHGRDTVIRVADSGVGIHPRDMHRLFQKFSRIDNELSIEAGGNGIGLYLCRQIVLLHNGRITAESRAGSGSVFTITLPTNKFLPI